VVDTHPRLWKAVAAILADRLRERAKFHRPPNPQPIIFIGSSVEGLPVAKTIELGLKHAKSEVRVWTSGVFGPSGIAADELLKQAGSPPKLLILV
jgi:predicted nucleotide-binding protein